MLGSLISGLGSLAGGLIGGSMDATAADNLADQAWDRQKKMLTNQIQWRVTDANKAGIHPLAALGLNPASGPDAGVIGGSGFASGLAQAGQDIGDAIGRGLAPADRVANQMTALQLERAKLENDLIKSQIVSQKVRSVQQATPGLVNGAKVNPDGSVEPAQNKMGSSVIKIPIPKMFGGGDYDINVRHGGHAQQVADNWGDTMQEIYGWYASAVDVLDNVYGEGEQDYWKHYMKPTMEKMTGQDYFGVTPDASDYRW